MKGFIIVLFEIRFILNSKNIKQTLLMYLLHISKAACSFLYKTIYFYHLKCRKSFTKMEPKWKKIAKTTENCDIKENE